MKRVLTDLDFAAYYKEEKSIDKFFLNEMGFESQTAALTPGLMLGRKIYYDPTDARPHVDVFFDKLNMCHVVSWEKGRLDLDKPTISLADLTLEKLQIVHINEKDVKDVMMLLLEHAVGDSDDEVVNGNYISKLMAKDWGFYYTSTTNLNKIKSLLNEYDALAQDDRDVISGRIDDLLQHDRERAEVARVEAQGQSGHQEAVVQRRRRGGARRAPDVEEGPRGQWPNLTVELRQDPGLRRYTTRQPAYVRLRPARRVWQPVGS